MGAFILMPYPSLPTQINCIVPWKSLAGPDDLTIYSWEFTHMVYNIHTLYIIETLFLLVWLTGGFRVK